MPRPYNRNKTRDRIAKQARIAADRAAWTARVYAPDAVVLADIAATRAAGDADTASRLEICRKYRDPNGPDPR